MFGDESFQPLGLAYIAAVLEQNGYIVKIIDLLIEHYSDQELINIIKKFQPRYCGLSIVTPVANRAFYLARLIKKTAKNIITIAGGPHATACAEECLRKGFDFAVRGEGEETVIDLLQHKNNPAAIKGISYRQGNQVRHNPDRPYIKDLDALPFPARHLLPDLKLYKGQEALGNRLPVATIITSRGCPFKCNFCFKAIFGNRFRSRSAQNVIQEWLYLIKTYKVKEIAIVDDTFTSNIKRVYRICDFLIKNKIKTRWSCPNGIRVDLGGYPLLKQMQQAGCYRVALGVESGSQKVLDFIGKKITLQQIKQTAVNCKKAGIKTMAFLMLGNLCENRTTMQQTIDFAKKVPFTYVQFLLTIPYPGTFLYEEIKRNGRLFIQDWDQYGQYEETASFAYGDITPQLLAEMSKKAYRQYYFRISYILKQIFNLENYKYLPRRLKSAFKVFSS
ncbi:MAG TPA: radical SAM protein [Spirochaetota bacterium]|nr:radical SAM protein [Spirochaetota bacterium]